MIKTRLLAIELEMMLLRRKVSEVEDNAELTELNRQIGELYNERATLLKYKSEGAL